MISNYTLSGDISSFKPYRVETHTFDHCSVNTGHFLMIIEISDCWTLETSLYPTFVMLAQPQETVWMAQFSVLYQKID